MALIFMMKPAELLEFVSIFFWENQDKENPYIITYKKLYTLNPVNE